jgi:hypothetical protein
MEKKQLFQIKIFESKLQLANKELDILLDEKHRLEIEKAILVATQLEKQKTLEKLRKIKIRTNKKLGIKNDPSLDLDDTTDTNINIIEDVLELKQQIKNLEITIPLNKSNISNTTSQITNNIHKIKLLPTKCNENITIEENILIDELNRIEIQKQEAIDNYDILHKKALEDKDKLNLEINNIKNLINIQNDKIILLQQESHQFRKNVLNELHIKKQNKVELQNNIELYENISNNFKTKINTLNDNITKLTILKTKLIAQQYNSATSNINSIDPIDPETLNRVNIIAEYSNLFGIDETFGITDKIVEIDRQLNQNKLILNNINVKYNSSNRSSDIKIKELVTIYNQSSCNKVISYKDAYKIEKHIKTNYETKLTELTNKYNNYDIEVLKLLKTELDNKITIFDDDIARAKERLTIMSDRFKNDQETSQNELVVLNESLMVNLGKYKLYLENANKKYSELLKQLENINHIDYKLLNINNDIDKQTTIVNQITLDITKLYNTNDK